MNIAFYGDSEAVSRCEQAFSQTYKIVAYWRYPHTFHWLAICLLWADAFPHWKHDISLLKRTFSILIKPENGKPHQEIFPIHLIFCIQFSKKMFWGFWVYFSKIMIFYFKVMGRESYAQELKVWAIESYQWEE